MRRNIILACTLAALCVCITACGKNREAPPPDEPVVSNAADSSDVPEDEVMQGEIIDDDHGRTPASGEDVDAPDDKRDGITEDEIVDYRLYAYTTDTVRLRSMPSTDSGIVQTLKRKTVLKVAGIDADNWAQVQTESGAEGFVSADYITEPVSEEEWSVQQEQMLNQKTICIDAGHQEHGNYDKEPVGPGASESKAKVSSGTQGVSTGKMEYELTLEVALALQNELEGRGYTVIMCRTKNDVDISNAERAAVANDAGVDAFLRIHADGAENASAQGAHAICQTAGNPYNGNLYEQSLRLSQCVISEYLAATGARQAKADDGVDERDDLSGINWCSVPVTLIELGFMTNPAEDTQMSSADYQAKMVTGIANGLDRYFEEL